MDKIKLGVRVHYHHLISDEGFENFLNFCEQYRDQIDELSLFNHYSLQAYIPPEEDEAICRLWAKRMQVLRERGYKSVGINMLTTIGHGDEDYEGMPLDTVVGHEGWKARGAACPTSEEFKEYTAARYRRYAELKPDFIWADDDNRLYHVGALYPCFCERCMGIFNARHGYSYTRESLVKDMEVPENIELRAQWVQFVEDRIADTFALIEKTVHDVDPNIELGYMSTLQLDGSIITYNGMNWDHWLTAMKAKRARPGTTIFEDRTPRDLMVKAMLCGYQVDDYPAAVRDRLYEHENYPYSTYRKSHVFEVAECTLALANGANGVYANTMDDRNIDVFDESNPFFDRVRAKRAAWDTMKIFSEKGTGYGFYPAISKNYDKRRPLHYGESFFVEKSGLRKTNWTTSSTFHDIRAAFTIGEIGVPLTCDSKHAMGTVLCGDMADGFTVEELTDMLSRPVLMDAYSLRALERRGLGHLTGVKLDQFWEGSYHERLNKEDPANAGIKNDYRDTREYAADYGGNSGSATLIPLDESVRIVTYLESFTNVHKGVAMTLYENELGGRICVMGYSAYTMVDSLTRRKQMMNICDWLTGGKLQSKLLTNCLAAQFVRQEGKRTMVTLGSMSLDGIEKPEIAVYGAEKATYLGDNGNFVELEVRKDGEYGVFTIPSVRAFDAATVIAE